jgi:hypothetical protein
MHAGTGPIGDVARDPDIALPPARGGGGKGGVAGGLVAWGG